MKIQPVYFLLLPDTLLLDLAGPADALIFANRYQDDIRFDLRFMGPQTQITSSVGLQLSPLQALPPTIEANAIIVLPGLIGAHCDYNSVPERAAVSWLRQHFQPQHRLVCICSGALLAAHAGLLHGHNATTHHDHCTDLARIDSSIHIEENRIFVEHGNISTSAGVTAGIDLALHLISELTTPMIATAVARNMVVYMRRSGIVPQLSPWLRHRNHLHPVVHRVQNAIIKNPAHDWDLQELAKIACASTRHLTRLFQSHAEVSVQEYLTSLRLSLASQMLTQTNLSIDKIAQTAGFGSTRQFRRQWHKAYAHPPSSHR